MDQNSTNSLDNKRIAKNAIMLTIRMIVVTFVGLYTSRVVFAQLGDINYGIYGVVGGILGFMSFLTSAMAGASSRFITYEIGRGSNECINNIFNASFLIHCSIAIIVIIVGETFGLWFLKNVIVIPSDRMYAATWVFQFSIISSAISITQVPYTAVIMAYEKMNIYAYMEFINVALKLVIVYLLSISGYDKLITYSFLLLLVSGIMAFSYRLYCMRSFKICKIKKAHDIKIIKQMLSFSAMDLYGNIGATLNGQGITYAINIFFGVVYNAAANLANTANGVILSLTTTIAIAFKPQIIKQYAQGHVANMELVMINSVKFTILATALLAIPCLIEAEYVMKLWLGQIPAHSVEFLRIIIIQSFFSVINSVCNSAIHANGNIKLLTFINGSVFIILPVIIFIAFHFGASVLWGYGIEIIGMIVIVSNAIIIIKHLIPDFEIKPFINTILICSLIIAACAIPAVYIHNNLSFQFCRLIIVTFVYDMTLGVLAWTILLTSENRQQLISQAKLLLLKFKF